MSALVVDMFVVVLCDILGVFWEVLAHWGQSYGLQVITGSLTIWHAADSMSVRPTCQEHGTRVHARTHTHGAAEQLQVLQHESLLFEAVLLKQSHATLQVEKVQIGASSSLLLF